MKDKKILIVDDEADLVKLVQKRIQANGYQVHSYCHGEGAFETVKQMHPDLLLLDLHMPQVSGEEIFKRIRAQDELRDIPVVFFSADATQEGHCLEDLKADGFLAKPFETNDLLSVIHQRLPKD